MKLKIGDAVRDLTGKTGKVVKVLDSKKLVYDYEVEFPDKSTALLQNQE